jgi:hypothetical protein
VERDVAIRRAVLGEDAYLHDATHSVRVQQRGRRDVRERAVRGVRGERRGAPVHEGAAVPRAVGLYRDEYARRGARHLREELGGVVAERAPGARAHRRDERVSSEAP